MFEPQSDRKKELCCVVESNGQVWRFKSIAIIKTGGYTKFVCCGQRCNRKVFFADQVNFVVDRFRTRLFDREREFRKRQRNKHARDAIKFDMTLRQHDVVDHVKTRVRMTTSVERTLFKCVSRNIARCCPNVPQITAEFFIPDELKQAVTEQDDVGDSNLLSTTVQPEKTPTTASSFSRRTACDNALQSRRNCTPTIHIEQFPTSETIYTIHGDIDGTLYLIFSFQLKTNRKRRSRGRSSQQTVLAIIQ